MFMRTKEESLIDREASWVILYNRRRNLENLRIETRTAHNDIDAIDESSNDLLVLLYSIQFEIDLSLTSLSDRRSIS